MSKDSTGPKGTSKRNSSVGSEATRNILQDVCLDFESIDVAPKTNKIGVIKNIKKPDTQQQENSGTSSFKVTGTSSNQENSGNSSFKITDASSNQENSSNSSFKVTDASSQQDNSGNSSFKVTDASSQQDNSGTSSFKVMDASSDLVVNNQTNNSVVLTIQNEDQLRTGNQNDIGPSSDVEPVQDSVLTDVVNVESNIPTSSTCFPTTTSSNLTVLPKDLAGAKSLSSLAQLADAEIVQSGDNVSIIVTNPRLIKVLTDASASIAELQPAAVIESPDVLQTQVSADGQVGIIDSDILAGDVFDDFNMAENSVVIEEEVVSESSSSRSGSDHKTPKRIFSSSGRFPKRPLSAQPCYAPSTPGSRARRITTRMKAAWSRLLEMDGHLVCQMPGCSQTFVTVANFQTHYKFCSGKKTLKKCDYCASMIFSTPKAMLQHMEVEHPDKVEEYKAAHPEIMLELERSNSPSHLLISEDENVAMNLEEVTHQPVKYSRKRKLSPKENIVPRKKVILKHKLQSIQNSMAENAKEFKKCVRFDTIADKINAVEEACNFEIPTGSDLTKKTKKKRNIFTERIVAEEKYFEDDEDVDTPQNATDETPSEDPLSLREKNHTKARMLLNLDRYKRYQEYLTVTRDWSSERRTYSRSRCSDMSADNSFDENAFLAHLHNESLQDPNQLNNVVESSSISMPTPEAEITEIQFNPAETYQVLETGQFVSAIPVPTEPAMNEISAAMALNRIDDAQTRSNLARSPPSISSPAEKTSEIKVKREKTACYNRLSFETPKQKPKLGIITYGLTVPNAEVNKPVEPPITFDSLVNSMMPKSARRNSQAGADKTVVAHADVNKSSKESGTKLPNKSPPQAKKRGRPPKIKTEETNLKDGKTLKHKAIKNNSGKKYSAAMLKTIETNLKNRKIKLFGVKKNSRFKSKQYSKESCKHSKSLKAKNIAMKQSKRNLLAKRILNRTEKPCKTKSVDNATVLCQENIDNHLPLDQAVDNVSRNPCLTADHNYTQLGIAVANSITEAQSLPNANNVAGEIEVSTSTTENIQLSASDKIEISYQNIQTEQIASTTETVKDSIVPDSLNNSAETVHSLSGDDDATKKDLPESVDRNVQAEETVSVIQAVSDAAVPYPPNSSVEVAQSLPTDDGAAKKDFKQTVDNSDSNLAQVERLDMCIDTTNQSGQLSVDKSLMSTKKSAQTVQKSIKSLPENIQNNRDSALDTTPTPEITVNKVIDQECDSLATQEKQSEEITTEQLKETENVSSEAPDLSADKYIQSNLIAEDSSATELSAPTLVRENESSQDPSTKSVEEQSVENEKQTSALTSENIETPLPEVPVKRGRGRPRKSANKTSPTESSQQKKDKPDKSLVLTDDKDNETDAKHSVDQKLVADNSDSTPVRKSQRIRKRKVVGDEMFETPLAEAKSKEQKGGVIQKQREEVTPNQKEEVIPKQKGKITPKQKGEDTPKQEGEVTPSTPGSQPRRRGRPKKYPPKDSLIELPPADNMHDDEVQELAKIEQGSIEENQRKYSRKGRPRKCVRYADLNSGVDSSESLDGLTSPGAGKYKSDSVKGKNARGADNLDESVKDMVESVNEQGEEIVLPLKKRKQRQSKKNDDAEVKILESSSHIAENADKLHDKEKKCVENDDDIVEESSENSRQRKKRKRTGSSDEEWDPSVHLKRRQSSRLSHQKSQLDFVESSDDSDSDFEKTDRSLSKSKKTEARKFGSFTKGIQSSKLSSGLLLKYSLETFKEVLAEYKPLKSMWKLLSNEEYILPPFKTSAYFKIEKTWEESEAYWQSLDLFDSVPLDKNSAHETFFTGGPATCSAWCPVPVDGNNVQYVALAVSYGVDKVHSFAFSEPERGLLQLWNVGDLRKKRLVTRPLMELAIFHDFAPINDMKWCPYGWENPDGDRLDGMLPRLGLLALACADSCVRIYSMPHPNSLPKQGTCYPIYSASPAVTLEPMHGDTCNVTKKSMCISLAWQKTDGCERIAAGYGSGMICVWRLNCLATILTSKENNQTILSPYLIFIGHGTPVLGLSFAPLPGGRYMVSSSIDKTLKFWDLLDTSIPFYTVKKGAGKSAEWSNVYCGAFGTMEVGLNNFKGSVFFKECGTELFTPKSLCNPSCYALKTAFSEWLNAMAITDIVGGVSVSMAYTYNMIQEHPRTPTYFHRLLYQSELKPVEGIYEKMAFSSYLENVDCISTLKLISDVASVINKLVQVISPDDQSEKQGVKKNVQNISEGLTDDQYRELSGNVNSLMTIEQMKEVITVVHELTENCDSVDKSVNVESSAKAETTKETDMEVPTNDLSVSHHEEDYKAKGQEHASELQSSVSSKLSEITDIVTLVTDIKDVTYTVEEVACDSSIGSEDLVMDLDEEPVRDSLNLPVGELGIESEIVEDALASCKDQVLVPSEIADLLNDLIDILEKNETASCYETYSQVSAEQKMHENTMPVIQSDDISCVYVVDEMTDVVTVLKDVSEKCEAAELLDVDAEQILIITPVQNEFTNLSVTELTNKMDEELFFSDSKIIESVLQNIKDVICTADEIVEETCKLQNFEVIDNYREMPLINISTDSVEEPNDHDNVSCSKKMLTKETEFNFHQSEISDIVASVADMKETFEVIENMKDTAEVISDMNDTATILSDMNITTEILQDMNVTTELISNMNNTAEVVSDMNDAVELVGDLRDVVGIMSDVNETTEVVSHMKEIVSSVEDMKEFNFVMEMINCACVEDHLLSDASAVLGGIIERVSQEVDDELAVQNLLHKIVSNIQMMVEAETERSCVSDISKEKHLSPSNPSKELSPVSPSDIISDENNCVLSVPNMKMFDVCEMDEQMLSADSESSSSENEMESDEEMEVDNPYLFDQDSNLSDDSILSECSLASVVSICSFSSESDLSEDSSMSFHDDLVIDESVSNSEYVSSEAVTLPSESSQNCNLANEPSCDSPSKTTEMDVSLSEDPNTKPESESLASAVLNSESSKVSFVENSLEETVLTVESCGVVPDSQDIQSKEKPISDEANTAVSVDSSVIPNSEISSEASERHVSETVDYLNDASASSAEKTEVITLTDEASTSKSCDMNSSNESSEIAVQSVQEPSTDNIEKSTDCSETLNSSESLIECNSSDTVPSKMPEVIVDSGDVTEAIKSSEHEGVRTAVTEPNVDFARKTIPFKKKSCYEDVVSQYGIVFKDMDSANFHQVENTNFEEFNADSLNPCHLTHVKTVSWNPNFGSHFWLFSAGQSGIARLSYVSVNQPVISKKKKK